MEIQTEFKINDLVVKKYDSNADDSKLVLEVIEIKSVTCCAGTQTFYSIRPIGVNKVKKYVSKNEEEKPEWNIERHLIKDNLYPILREDEIIECPPFYKNLVLGEYS